MATGTGRSAIRAASRRTPAAKGHVAAWVAWGICGFYWVAVAVGFMLRALSDPRFPAGGELSWRIGFGAYPTVGALILARQPRNRIGWLCCAVGLLVGPAALAQDAAWYALVHRSGSLPGGLALGWLGSWPWYLAIGLTIMFLPLLFPTGRLVSRQWRPVAWAAAATTGAGWFWAAFAPRPLELPPGTEQSFANPMGFGGAKAVFNTIAATAPPAYGVLAILSVASMVVRFRRSRGVERQQLKWFTYGAAAAMLGYLLFALSNVARLPSVLSWIANDIWLGAGPVAIGVAVLRYRLYDIDHLISRTLVYGLLTALLAGVYTGLVLGLGELFGQVGTEPPGWAIAGATLAVAALFQPARRRIQAVVDRRFNRRRYDAAKTIEAFSARLREQIDLDTLTGELLAVVNQTMEPTKASLWLRPSTEHLSR